MKVSESAFVMLFAAVAFLGAVAVGTLPRTGEEIVVFAPPGADRAGAARIVARAGGELVAATALGWAVIARSDDASFADRLYFNGALFVAGGGIAALCAPGYSGIREKPDE